MSVEAGEREWVSGLGVEVFSRGSDLRAAGLCSSCRQASNVGGLLGRGMDLLECVQIGRVEEKGSGVFSSSRWVAGLSAK